MKPDDKTNSRARRRAALGWKPKGKTVLRLSGNIQPTAPSFVFHVQPEQRFGFNLLAQTDGRFRIDQRRGHLENFIVLATDEAELLADALADATRTFCMGTVL